MMEKQSTSSNSRRKLLIGNWKMYGDLKRNEAWGSLARENSSALIPELAVCVPFPYIVGMGHLLEGLPIALGAQDLSDQEEGAYTGEVSASMLRDVGVRYVIIGHSERRRRWYETEECIAAKCRVALKNDLIPILCVGETKAERDAGLTEIVIANQLKLALSEIILAERSSQSSNVVIAYEPVWAIGTGRSASPPDAEAVHRFIRGYVAQQNPVLAESILIVYGGSIRVDNVRDLLAMKDIDGGLVGGASLDAPTFISVAREVLRS